MNILIIEDDIFISEKIKLFFIKNYFVNICNLINQFNDFLNYLYCIDAYDLILLDINLNDKLGNGFDILKIIRKKNSIIPIIIITGDTSLDKMNYFFNYGASDYIFKPFNLNELGIRVFKYFKIYFLNLKFINTNIINYNGLIYDFLLNEFYFNGNLILLTKKNKFLLLIFLSNNEKFLSKDFLSTKLFGNSDTFLGNENLKVYIYRLKKTLKNFSLNFRIKNIRGEGYIFKKQ